MKAYITDIEYVLPKTKVENPKNRLTNKTGILYRHICSENECASDLAYIVAKIILNRSKNKNRIDFLILCTQSPDYFLPTTACILQNRLGLPSSCGAFDYNLGCSGYIYGLSIAKGLIESGQAENVLLLTAETYSKYVNPKDNSVYPIFGDAASATLIKGYPENKSGLYGFILGTNGAGFKDLIVPVGGSRNRNNTSKLEDTLDEYGNYRTNRDLFMDGSSITDFALDVVPKTVDKILSKTSMSKSDIDYYVFHQANKFILDFLQSKCGLINYPYWNNVKEYGNTVSCSIPIALVDMLKNNIDKNINKVLTVGFGVGLSWGGCIVDLSKLSTEI